MSKRPKPRDVLAHAFLINLEYNLGKQVEEVSDNLADIALKALRDAGYNLWYRVDRDDEEIENQW